MTPTSRIALVLGAGGVAGGAFHSGVLAALHEAMGWDPRRADVVVGTSAGSIAGSTLRAGLSPGDMFARSEGRPLSPAGAAMVARIGPYHGPPLFRPTPRRRSAQDMAATLRRAVARPFSAPPWALLAGLLPEGQIDTTMISAAVGGFLPDRWPAADLWICAVRQDSGRRTVFGRDRRDAKVAEAVAASCAIPGFFAPVSIDGATYIDGGVHSPTNADVLLERDDEVPALVLVSSPMSQSGSPRLSPSSVTPMNAVRRWSGALLSAEAVRLRRRGAHVFAFQPTAADVAVMGANAMDPTRRAAIARQAYESTLRRMERHDSRERLALLRDAVR